MEALRADLEARLPDAVSPKGNGLSFWLKNCRWDERHSEEALRKDNLLQLMKLGQIEDRKLLIEQAEALLEELRATAKGAGAAKWDPDRDKKIIARAALRGWWEARTREIIEGASARIGLESCGQDGRCCAF